MGLTAGRYYLSQRYEISLTYYIHLLLIYIDALSMRLPRMTINQDLQAFDLMVSLCTYILTASEAKSTRRHDLTRGRESVISTRVGREEYVDGGKR